MKNLAGVKEADAYIREELTIAGVEISKVDLSSGEVPYTLMGKIGNWKLYRAWYYWMAGVENQEDGLPLDIANKLHYKEYPLNTSSSDDEPTNYGYYVRVAGHAGAPPPEECAYPSKNELEEQLDKLGIENRTYGNLSKLLNEGVLKGKRYVRNYHIDSQEGLNEFVRTVKSTLPQRERIVCSAIWIDDGQTHPHQPRNINSGFVICGLRHNNCYAVASIIYPDMSYKKIAKQGFLTDRDCFIDRAGAMILAQSAGQVNKEDVGARISLDSSDIFKP